VTYNIFDSKGRFCSMPLDEQNALQPAELDLYLAVLDSADKCAISEALVVSLERQLVEQTADIRAMTTKLAKYPKPSRIDEVRHVLMRDGI
jgi:hypothetical protein